MTRALHPTDDAAPQHWADLPGAPAAPRTQRILDTLCDIRLPLGLAPQACDRIIATLTATHAAVLAGESR